MLSYIQISIKVTNCSHNQSAYVHLFSHNVTSTLTYVYTVLLLTMTILLSFVDVMIPEMTCEVLTSVVNTYLFPKRYGYPKSL